MSADADAQISDQELMDLALVWARQIMPTEERPGYYEDGDTVQIPGDWYFRVKGGEVLTGFWSTSRVVVA